MTVSILNNNKTKCIFIDIFFAENFENFKKILNIKQKITNCAYIF